MDERMAAIDAKEEMIIEALGPETALDAILRALDYDTKDDVLATSSVCMTWKEATLRNKENPGKYIPGLP